MNRRNALEALVAATLWACGGTAPAPPPAPSLPPLPPLKTDRLTDLLALAHLRWIVLSRPREIAQVPWLIPPINAVVKEENLNRFAKETGLDLRQISEAAVANYRDENGEASFYLVRHATDPAKIERAFAARISSEAHRSEDRRDIVRLAGKIGTATSEVVILGGEVVGFQSGGSSARGPARIAALYAEGKLKKSPTVLAEQPLKGLAERFGSAPVTAYALGPFEGELARGARGLLAGATAIGASARPSSREGVALAIAVAGDFSKSGDPASRELASAWADLANGSFGHLLGLDHPVDKPLSTFAPDAVALAVEINPQKLAEGLAAATSQRIEEIMR